MKPPSHEGREYRVLALSVAFFLVGLFFFFTESQPPATTSPPSPQPLPVSSATGVPEVAPGGAYEQSLDPEFAGFPPPSQFRMFTYNAAGINGSPYLAVSSTCSAAYVAILVFPVAVDYRSDVRDAAYNKAIPCGAIGDIVNVTITPADLSGAPFGTYYFFTADEGTSSLWYNPK